MPPSTLMIWPVMKLAFSESKKAAIDAISWDVPTFCNGCLAAEASRFSGVFNSLSAKGVSVRDGAIQLTLIDGASSAASDLVSPSTAPLAADTDE